MNMNSCARAAAGDARVCLAMSGGPSGKETVWVGGGSPSGPDRPFRPYGYDQPWRHVSGTWVATVGAVTLAVSAFLPWISFGFGPFSVRISPFSLVGQLQGFADGLTGAMTSGMPSATATGVSVAAMLPWIMRSFWGILVLTGIASGLGLFWTPRLWRLAHRLGAVGLGLLITLVGFAQARGAAPAHASTGGLDSGMALSAISGMAQVLGAGFYACIIGLLVLVLGTVLEVIQLRTLETDPGGPSA